MVSDNSNEKPTVLVVEDEFIVAEDIRQRLIRTGYSVLAITPTGAEALRWVEGTRPDLVLMDIMLKGDMDGVQTAEQIRKKYDVPVIYLTASSDNATLQRAKKTEAYGYIIKPFDTQSLNATIEVALFKHQAEKRVRESEARYRTIVDTDGLLICRFLQDGRLTFANRAFSRVFPQAYHSNLETVFKEYVLETDRYLVETTFTNLLPTTPIQTVELRMAMPGVDVRWMRWTFRPVLDSDCRFLEFQGIGQDITLAKQADEELRTMSQQLWQTTKLATLGELAASVAHELNNPLAIISLRIENLMYQMDADDPKKKPLQIIEQEVERMANLISNLLEFSRKSRRESVLINLQDEIENALELIYYHLRNSDIKVEKVLGRAPASLQADRQELRQVLINLFINASDAMPDGGTLTVQLETDEGPPTFHTVIVQDTGIGIKKEYLKKVFEPFFTTKADNKGTGLGLPICQRIVHDHGGSIEIASEGIPEKGTMVTIKLPAIANVSSPIRL